MARPLLSASNILVQVVQAEVSTDATRVSRLAWIAAGAGGGIGLSAIAHSVLGGADGFRIQFGLALIPALGAWWLLRHVREPHSTSSADDMVSRLGRVPSAYRVRLVALCVVAGIVGIITGPANSFAFVYGENILHIPAHTVAAVVTASGVSGVGGLLLSRRLVRRYGRRLTVASGVAAAAVTSALAYSGGQHAFITGYLIGVGAAGLLAPASSTLIVESFPHAIRATASGWTVVAGIVGAVLGLVVFGFISDHVLTAHVGQSYRWPALLTFLPMLPALALLRMVPEPKFEHLD
jgi:Na+/melibiose symporter-like transporter